MMNDDYLVVFEMLPKRTFKEWLRHFFLGEERYNEHIVISFNGNLKIIKRGVPVRINKFYLEVADHANKEHKYDYEILEGTKEVLP